jgi:DNA-binding IclR family transcriptional regulator
MGDPKQNGAQAVYRALDVLAAFEGGQAALTAAEIADASGLTIPTAHRIIHALTERRFLFRDETRKTYSLGPSIQRLARLAASAHGSYELVVPLVAELRDTWGETVGLHVRSGDRRVCVHELESQHRVRVVSGVGHSYPLSSAAASKAILAHMREDDLAALARSLPVVGEMGAELETIRRRGYATSLGETIAGARAVAIPVLGADGFADAALNVTGPAERLDEARAEEIGRAMAARVAQLDTAMSRTRSDAS